MIDGLAISSVAVANADSTAVPLAAFRHPASTATTPNSPSPGWNRRIVQEADGEIALSAINH